MEKNMVIEFSNVYERYDIDMVIDGKSFSEKFLALQDINLKVKKGESVAIMGSNGSGKSTMLRIIAGLIKPDKGEITVIGRIGSLLDLGAGFHLELTGRDNLFLNASLYNLGKDMVNSRIEEVIKFAGIGKFIDAPLKCYSSGMYVRLAFSLAISVSPDILLVDDCLAVGDEEFQIKCIDKVLELKEKGVTIIFVTHNIHLAKEVCDRGVYIKSGQIVKDDVINEVALAYARPLSIDMKVYKYLGFKKQEEERKKQKEERKKQEENLALAEEITKHKNAFEELLKKHEDESRERQEEDRRRERWDLKRQAEDCKRQAEDRKRQAEDRKRQAEDLKRQADDRKRREDDLKLKKIIKNKEWGKHLENGLLSLKFDFGKIRIYYNNIEITVASGLYTSFSIAGVDYSSGEAISKLKKINQNEWMCYLKWRKPLSVMQIWKIKIIDKNTVNLEVILQTRGHQIIRNERIGLGLMKQYQPIGTNVADNKAAVLRIKGNPSLSFVSLQEDLASGFGTNVFGGPLLYFLLVHKAISHSERINKNRYLCFKGFISLDTANLTVSSRPSIKHTIKDNGLKVVFDKGQVDLFWHGKQLTQGMGMYSSIYSKGVWYDSTQAIWKIKEASERALIVEGFWPWVAISQTWKLSFDEEKKLFWDASMQVYEDTWIGIQEIAIMLSQKYTKWSAGNRYKEFPPEFTKNDIFRYCLWSDDANGKAFVKLESPTLPELLFQPQALKLNKIVLENSAHIYNICSRILHCLKQNQASSAWLTVGSYNLFKGYLNIGRKKK